VSCSIPRWARIKIAPPGPEVDESTGNVEKLPRAFDIDMLRCIYCGMCQEVCPEEAIFLQDIYSVVGTSREELVFKKQKLYELGGTLPDEHYKWDVKKQEAEPGNPHH